jgi:hypothetical protein
LTVLATRPGIRAAEAGAGRAKPTQTGWESGTGLLLGRNPSWRRAYHALLTSISHGQDLRRKMFRDRLELRGLAAPDGVALLRERDQEFESGSSSGESAPNTDDERYISIPDKRELDLGKPLVLDFAREFLPDDYDEVRHIFSRRGAYRRLKDLLVRRGAIDQWEDFSNKAEEAALREWCAENGIELTGP